MTWLRRAAYAVAFTALYVGSCIADLPRPSDWLAARRVRAERRRR